MSNNNTNNTAVTIRYGGITCQSDMGLYDGSSRNNAMYLMSIYGSPQQVRGIFSALATGREIIVGGKMPIARPIIHSLRFRGNAIGYAKQHGLIWIEDISKCIIMWMSEDGEEGKIRAFDKFLASRKIPYIKEWIEPIERLLLRKGYLIRLTGWGGINGYKCGYFSDDEICDLIVKEIVNGNINRLKIQHVAA